MRIIEERMKELTSSTSTLGTYTACAYFIVYDCDAAEQACHKALNRYRVQDNREFFEVPLSRLIRIVSEQVEPYAARNFVPDLEPDDPPKEQLDAKKMLSSARARRNEDNRLRGQALASARTTISELSSLIREKLLQIKADLKNESTLKWEIPDREEPHEIGSHEITMFSVTVMSLFSKEPLALWRHGIRDGIWGKLDLSRAIGEPEVSPIGNDVDGEFVRWKELDDGQVGRIDLIPSVKKDRENDVTTLPRIIVRTTPIQYDSYHNDFREGFKREKSYDDPAEAFEVFLALLIENVKERQYDVRKRGETFRSRRGKSQTKIVDHGKFETQLLED